MNGEQGDKPGIEEIISSSAALEEATASPASDELRALAERLDLLTADFGRWEEFKGASAEYVREFRTELKWIRITRAWVASVAAAIVLFFCLGLVIVLCQAQNIFGDGDPGHALTALIVAAVSGTVVITVTAIKGVFGTTVERNAGLPMPEHLKEVLEAAKGLFGKT